jgi:hypothetical protein
MKISVLVVLTIFLSIVTVVALVTKGDVKTRLKVVGIEFSLETKDKAAQGKASDTAGSLTLVPDRKALETSAAQGSEGGSVTEDHPPGRSR